MSAGVGEMIARWEARRAELARLHAQVDGAAIADDVLRDLAALEAAEAPVSLVEAALRTGYTADHLSRLVRDGALANHGRKGAPRVKLSECPTKPGLRGPYAPAYNPNADARSLGTRR
jgi:hypothetical protein